MCVCLSSRTPALCVFRLPSTEVVKSRHYPEGTVGAVSTWNPAIVSAEAATTENPEGQN